MASMVDVAITEAPLDLDTCVAKIADKSSGGVDVFIGTVRNETAGRAVVRLEFEAYASMALSELRRIADTALKRWPVHGVLIHHRNGVVEVGESAVIIVVSAARRDAAFKACRYCIDTLKKTVPIWKKEIFEDGEEWVTPHP